MARAFHIAQYRDLEGDGADLLPFAHVMANPYATWLSWARRPGQRVYASFDALTLAGSGPGVPWWDNLRAVLRQYATSYPAHGRKTRDLMWDFRDLEGALAYGAWIIGHVKPNDGVYLDNMFGDLPDYVLADYPAELRLAMAAAWPAWRDVLIARLRARPAIVIVGNSAGATFALLNGIGIEGSHWAKLGGVVGVLARFAIQWTRGRQPRASVDWSNQLELGDMIVRGFVRENP